ncbi:hypothetical protein BHM03_00007255 [Ensete ventricosum]|nr:hypothetical protein BHM03_00007255 [Ensete ventricosum]
MDAAASLAAARSTLADLRSIDLSSPSEKYEEEPPGSEQLRHTKEGAAASSRQAECAMEGQREQRTTGEAPPPSRRRSKQETQNEPGWYRRTQEVQRRQKTVRWRTWWRGQGSRAPQPSPPHPAGRRSLFAPDGVVMAFAPSRFTSSKPYNNGDFTSEMPFPLAKSNTRECSPFPYLFAQALRFVGPSGSWGSGVAVWTIYGTELRRFRSSIDYRVLRLGVSVCLESLRANLGY